MREPGRGREIQKIILIIIIIIIIIVYSLNGIM